MPRWKWFAERYEPDSTEPEPEQDKPARVERECHDTTRPFPSRPPAWNAPTVIGHAELRTLGEMYRLNAGRWPQ